MTIESVVALAAEQPPGDITTAAIAKRMGVTQGALFRHFPSKEAIWEAVMQWVAERLLACIDEAAQGHSTTLGVLEAMFIRHAAFAVEHPGVPRLMFSELQHSCATPAKHKAQKLMQHYAERLVARIGFGQARGELARDIEPQAAAVLFIGSIQGLVMQAMLSGDITQITRQAPEVFDLYARALQSSPQYVPPRSPS